MEQDAETLKLLGHLASIPAISGDFQTILERILEYLCNAVNANDAEFWLMDPYRRELLISAYIGQNKDAFTERTLFQPGQGFPGIAYAQRRLILSRELAREPRFLRRAVVGCGVRTFISVPIPGAQDHPLGCFDLAWRRSGLPMQNISRTLLILARPIGNLIAAGMFGLREHVFSPLNSESDWTKENVVRAALNTLIFNSHADSGTAICRTSADHTPHQISIGGCPPKCSILNDSNQATCQNRNKDNFLCALARLESKSVEESSVYCLPLMAGVDFKGVALLRFQHPPLNFPLWSLIPLQMVTRELALQLPLFQRQKNYRIEVRGQPRAPLEIRCFGQFEVLIEGKPLPRNEFSRRQGLTALKILVLNSWRSVHRERLIEWIWPNEGTKKVKINRLFGVIHSLRLAIEPHADDQSWHYILRNEEHYSFNAGRDVFIDLVRFRELISALRTGKSKSSDELLHNLEEVVELYRGSLFEEDLYSEWCSLERTQLEHEFMDVLMRLASFQFHRRDFEKCIYSLRKGLSMDPLREDFHQMMIESLRKIGRIKEANRHKQEFVQLMQDELGVTPNPVIWTA